MKMGPSPQQEAVITVGPSLKKPETHQDIHAATNGELADATDLLRRVLGKGDAETALQLAQALVETWKTRVLSHADIEEETLYPWTLEQHPERHDRIAQLKAQHAILHRLVTEVDAILTSENRVTGDAMRRLDASLLVCGYHGEDEVQFLSTI